MGQIPDGRAGKENPGAIMRVLQPDVLCLMIVNISSKEKMASTTSAVKDAKVSRWRLWKVGLFPFDWTW